MKSACYQFVFQRVRGRCERIYEKTEHFPSELAGSRSHATNSPARSDTVIRQAKCWLCRFMQSQNAGGTAENVFPSRILYGFGTFLSPFAGKEIAV